MRKSDGWPALLHAFGELWVVCWKDATLCAHDEETGQLRRRISLGGVPGPSGIAASERHLWVTHVGARCVLQVDPSDGSVSDPIAVGKAPWCLVVNQEQVWVANTDSGNVSVIDCVTATVVRTWEAASAPYGLAVGDDSIWVGLRRPPALARFPWK